MAAGDDEFGGGLVLAGLLALGRETPWRDRMPAARGTALAAAMRMVDRVRGGAAIQWALVKLDALAIKWRRVSRISAPPAVAEVGGAPKRC